MSNNLKLINTNTINSKPIRNYIKVKNTGGPKGDTGATGATGPQGPQGPAGQAATINIGETTTLLPGQTATVTNTGTQQNATLNFGIPQGLRGPTGAQGPKGDTGPQGLKGDKGDAGAAATIQVNATNTGAPGTNAQVTNIGNEHFAQLNFTIPRGATGATGAQGPQGPQGPQGEKGNDGAAATITVGTTTTTNPGTSATVTNSGTTSAAVLNFGIPRGATGSVKSEVVSELPGSGEGDTFYLVNREATTQTATGKTINFTNSENAGDITDAQIDGETSQNGTPTPSAPVAVQTVTGENAVKICGKNLINFDSFQQSWDGASVEGEGTTITMSPNTSGSMGLLYDSTTYSVSIPAGRTITWSRTWAGGGTWESGTITFPLKLTYSDGTTETLSFGDTTENNYNQVMGTTKTLTKSVVSVKIESGGCFGITNLSAPTSFNLQLELGSTATAYEAYKSQSYEVNFNLEHGKNMLDPSTLVDGYISVNGEYNTAHSNDEMRSGMIAVEPNTAYTFSIQATSSTYDPWFGVGEYTSDNVTSFVRRDTNSAAGATSITFTTSATTNYIAVSARNLKTATKVQLEQGSSATTYEPWSPLELCKIGDYQDYIWNDGGTWKVHKATGILAVYTSTITLQSNYTNIEYGRIDKPSDYVGYNNYEDASIICSDALYQAGGVSPVWDNANNINYIYSRADNWRFWLGFEKGTGLDAIKTALTGCKIVYPLTTPTDTEITNSALITQLDNLASAALYSGVNNIFTVTPNEVPILELDYVTYDKYNQNKVYIWNDDLQQWQIIVQ